jgi:hypothetical protein
MGLDYEVPGRESPLVDQSAKTGKWGLVGQIEESERGRIPDDTQSLLRRATDERVRRALDCGCDRETVTEVFDIAERTSWHKQRRAQAYDFPLGALERGGSTESSRETGDATDDDTADATDKSPASGTEQPQQRLDAVADGSGDSDDGTSGAVTHGATAGGHLDGDAAAVSATDLARAIETLTTVADHIDTQ